MSLFNLVLSAIFSFCCCSYLRESQLSGPSPTACGVSALIDTCHPFIEQRQCSQVGTPLTIHTDDLREMSTSSPSNDVEIAEAMCMALFLEFAFAFACWVDLEN
jgi:hypothetical protein